MITKKKSPAPAKNEQLVKDSTPEQMKNYFGKVLELTKSGKEFPINMDDVWPLVYSRKRRAISVLRSDFIEGEDFNLHQMGQVVKSNELRNGVKLDAKLSVSCMEYFIAKKVRPVFEVYRQVFHKAANQGQKAISDEATYIEDVIFPNRLGDSMVQCYYTNGKLYVRMNTLLKFLSDRSWGKHLLQKLGEDNVIYVSIGKASVPFGSYEAFRSYLRYFPNQCSKK